MNSVAILFLQVIRNKRELEALELSTYILAVIVALVAWGLSILIANIIAFEGGKNPKDPFKRKLWFWVLGVFAPACFFLYNFFIVKTKIPKIALQTEFLNTIAICTGIILLLYIVLGFVLSKTMKKTKYGTIFPSK